MEIVESLGGRQTRISPLDSTAAEIMARLEAEAARLVVDAAELAAAVAAADASADAAAASAAIASAAVPQRYFVSNTGSDAANGLTPATAWLTLAKVVTAVLAGQTVRLQRGGIWREFLDLGLVDGVTIGAYGGGKRPIISARDVVSSFTLYSGTAYTCTVSLTIGTANRSYPGLFEDGVRLTEVVVGLNGIADAAAAIAYVVANQSTFYFAGPGTFAAGWAAGTKTYYVNATGGGNPASNGKVYEVYKRERAILTGGNVWEDIVFHMGWFHDGHDTKVGGGGVSPTIRRCASVQPARHTSLFAVAAFEDHDVIGSNAAYAGTLYHCNPATSSNQPVSTIKGGRIFGSENRTSITGAIGFYTHGDFNIASIEKAGWIISDVEVQNVATVVSLNDTTRAELTRLKARNFDVFSTASPLVEIHTDADVVGGAGASARIFDIPAGNAVTIRGGRWDLNSRHVLSRTATFDAGSITVEDALMICRAQRTTSSVNAFFRTETTAKLLQGLTLTRATLFMANDGSGYLAQAFSITSLAVTDLVIIGLVDSLGAPQRDPKLFLNSVSTALSSLLPNARVTWQDAARVIERDTDAGTIFRRGAYRPGMKIWSGAAYSQNGAQSPRTHVIVGDQIITMADNISAAIVQVASPTGHQNAVAFCNAATRTYVSVGQSGSIYSGDLNAFNFTARTSGISTNLLAVAAWTTGVVVAVGDGGVILKSTDSGVTWATIVSGTAARLRAIATDGTTWIAAGDGGVYGTSTDAGATWAWTTTGTADHYSLMWSAGLSLFFLGSDGGAIKTSPAAIAWTTRTTNTTQRVKCFAAGPDGVVAGLYQSQPHFGPSFLTSTAGVTWTPGATTLPFDVRAISGPGTSIYEQRAFWAVGESGFFAQARLITDEWAIRSVIYNTSIPTVPAIANLLTAVS